MKKYILLVLMLASTNAFSLQELTGKVAVVEPTLVPDRVSLQMDSGNSTCPAGKFEITSRPSLEAMVGRPLSIHGGDLSLR
ncbi:MAG: hypothetical protein ACI82Z_001985 [Cellvibrionaceae bacterium]|jgi:hypothetical protein